MADPSRNYFQVDNSVIGGMNGAVAPGPQWGSAMKPVQNNYYPYADWKVEDKKTPNKSQMRPMSTVNLSTVDIKHVAQIQIPQTVAQQNTWGGNPPAGSMILNRNVGPRWI
jgi:hypothetical protein